MTQRETERDRQTDAERQRDRQRKRDRQRDRDTDTETETQREDISKEYTLWRDFIFDVCDRQCYLHVTFTAVNALPLTYVVM